MVLAAAAAGVWFWLQSRLDETQQAHQAVYAEYQAMTAAADQLTLTVTEDGSPIGSYDMQTLGLRDGLLARITSQFSEVDRLSDEQTGSAGRSRDESRLRPLRPILASWIFLPYWLICRVSGAPRRRTPISIWWTASILSMMPSMATS